MAVILANPRYTGREVWHRHQSARPGAQRRINPAEAVVSRTAAHPALVSEADFLAVQQIRAARVNGDGALRRYLLAGLLMCGLCGRRMDAHWVNGRAGYRCRHGHSSARRGVPDRPRNLYVREDVLLAELVGRFIVDGRRARRRVCGRGLWRSSTTAPAGAWLAAMSRERGVTLLVREPTCASWGNTVSEGVAR